MGILLYHPRIMHNAENKSTHFYCFTWRNDEYIIAVPEGSEENQEFEVYNFTGNGGVTLAMYNTDEVGVDGFFFC